MSQPAFRTWLIAIGCHFAVLIPHDLAHISLGVFDGPVADAFIAIVVHIAPLAALWLARNGKTRPALMVLAWSMLASSAYGTYNHFLLAGHDHVAEVGLERAQVLWWTERGWQQVFVVSAWLLSPVDFALAMLAFVWARRSLFGRGPDVLLVDGLCVFCNGLVTHVVRRDPEARFYFAHLQSDYGVAVRERHRFPTDDVDGVYLLRGAGTDAETLLLDGAAGRHVWPKLYFAATPLMLVPAWLIDPMYKAFARVRYRFFGKLEACFVPDEHERQRLVDEHGPPVSRLPVSP